MDTRINHRGLEGELAAHSYNVRVNDSRKDRSERRANFIFMAMCLLFLFTFAFTFLGCRGGVIDGSPWGHIQMPEVSPVANPCDTCTPAR